jgi:5-methyltetrahydrofolate--homocysteine methyltransferase
MDFKKLNDAIIKGDAKRVTEITREAIGANIDPANILDQGLIAAMDVVGEKFSTGEFFIPEMLQSAIAMKEGVNLLKPLLTASQVEEKGTIVIGTVKGDLHDIGKNLVAMMLEGAGFKIVDLGTDVSPESFLNSIKENQAEVCGMSALLTTTMPKMEESIGIIRRELGHDQVKIIIGGAPVSQKYADEIGADGFAYDAGAAVERVKELIGNVAS